MDTTNTHIELNTDPVQLHETLRFALSPDAADSPTRRDARELAAVMVVEYLEGLCKLLRDLYPHIPYFKPGWTEPDRK